VPTLKPAPAPPGIVTKGAIGIIRAVVIIVAAIASALLPNLATWLFMSGIAAFVMAGWVGDSERSAERVRRADALKTAQTEYDELVEQARTSAGSLEFMGRRDALAKLRDEYDALPKSEALEIKTLHDTARARQLRKYLEACSIDKADIPGVGPARKAALRSWGIETAADVTYARVSLVKGFGDGLTQTMVAWRADFERRFASVPTQAVSISEVNAVRSRFQACRLSIEATLNRGADELRTLSLRASSQHALLLPRFVAAQLRIAQAKTDASIF
jgi:DNA-binding helix-hairpin-helix protein with protein kinase domain